MIADSHDQNFPACGGCGNKCTCETPPPPPPPAIPDSVPPFAAKICVEAGLFNFVVLADLGTTTYIGTDEAECIIGTSGSDSIFGGGGMSVKKGEKQ